MGVVVAYSVLALVFLALVVYTPKSWRELPEKQVKILRFGCLFGFLLLCFNIVYKFIALS